jgi:hypothetical protein
MLPYQTHAMRNHIPIMCLRLLVHLASIVGCYCVNMTQQRFSRDLPATAQCSPGFVIYPSLCHTHSPIAFMHRCLLLDPFSLTRDGDKLRGRGTTDCLGHAALLALLFKQLAVHKPSLKKSVVGVSSVRAASNSCIFMLIAFYCTNRIAYLSAVVVSPTNNDAVSNRIHTACCDAHVGQATLAARHRNRHAAQ